MMAGEYKYSQRAPYYDDSGAYSDIKMLRKKKHISALTADVSEGPAKFTALPLGLSKRCEEDKFHS
jgi:hypothetical protein